MNELLLFILFLYWEMLKCYCCKRAVFRVLLVCPAVEVLKKHTLGQKRDDNGTSSMLDLQGTPCHMLAESVHLVLFITAVFFNVLYCKIYPKNYFYFNVCKPCC